jgi:hypothetical protein
MLLKNIFQFQNDFLVIFRLKGRYVEENDEIGLAACGGGVGGLWGWVLE